MNRFTFWCLGNGSDRIAVGQNPGGGYFVYVEESEGGKFRGGKVYLERSELERLRDGITKLLDGV